MDIPKLVKEEWKRVEMNRVKFWADYFKDWEDTEKAKIFKNATLDTTPPKRYNASR